MKTILVLILVLSVLLVLYTGCSAEPIRGPKVYGPVIVEKIHIALGTYFQQTSYEMLIPSPARKKEMAEFEAEILRKLAE